VAELSVHRKLDNIPARIRGPGPYD